MHVFVDESGDLGFSKAATKYFIVAYIECNAPIKIQTDLKRLLKHLHQKENILQKPKRAQILKNG